jgi:hypothetical protein
VRNILIQEKRKMEGIPPPKFVPRGQNLVAQWRDFSEEFDTWLMAVGKSDAPDLQKLALLLLSMGKEYRTVFNRSLGLSDEEKKKFDTVRTKFDLYFEPMKLKKGYITQFQTRKQGENETLQQYITELREIADKCEFGAVLNTQLSVAISNGVKDLKLREKLWTQDLELDDIIKKCQQWEQKEQVKHLYDDTQQAASVSSEVHFSGRGRHFGRNGGRQDGYSRGRSRGRSSIPQEHVQQYGQRGRGSYSRGSGRGQQGGSESHSQYGLTDCGQCGSSHAVNRCPAYGKLCNICSMPNHFARRCRNKNVCYADRYDETVDACKFTDDSYDDRYDYETDRYDYNYDTDTETETQPKFVWCNESDSNVSWTVDFETPRNGKIRFKIDTAADVNIMSRTFYDSLKDKPRVKHSQTQIIGLGRQMLLPVGAIDLECVHKGERVFVRCEIVDAKVPNLVSLTDSIRLNLIKRVDAVGTQLVLPDSVKNCPHVGAVKLIEEFSDLFQGVGKVPGKVELKIDPTATPVAHPPRPVPVALRSAVQSKLQELVDADIIEKVPVGVPTPWCSALHVVPKRDGTVRLTIDPKDVNAALQREFHPTNTVEQVSQRCGKAQYFTVLDANQGYFQIQLDEKSRDLTAFNTPFGRFRYRRLPMGIKSSPELFQRVFGDLFSGIEDLEIIMDDFLIQADTLEEHDATLRTTLQRARENGVTFSIKKTQLCAPEVTYSGHKFTRAGMVMDQEKIKAVVEMPEPQSIQDVERLIGMVTYVCKYMKNLSSVTEPLRSLIKERKDPDFKWHFDASHREAVVKIKQMMTTAPVLKYYSLTDPIVISCDASQSGLGCVLMQNGKPVAFGSKALTHAEYAYAQIEKELLAIVFAIKKFHTYVYGRSDVTVETDHLPLVRIFEKPLHMVPLRLQKMRMRLQGHDFKIVAKKGTEIPVADALSRAYLKDEGPNLTDEENHIFTVSATELQSVQQISPPRLKEIQEETRKDDEIQAVQKVIREGWPETRRQVEPIVRPYFDFLEELWVLDEILYKGERIVIPQKMRGRALNMLHESHQGIVKTKQLARDLVYWPGLNKQVEDLISRCSPCQERRPVQQREPLLPTAIPELPWQHVAEDLFECFGEKWLICVDYYSEFFLIEKMATTDCDAITRQTKKWFSTHGIPDELTSDNGPPWNSGGWKKFAREYGFQHTTISPTHSQTNGLVEKAVGIAKNMLMKCKASDSDPYLALLNIRNTPRDDTAGSPAQRLFSRRTSTRLPTARQKLIPEAKKSEEVTERLKESRHRKAKKYYDEGTKPLQPLKSGDTIRVRVGKTWQPALLLPNQDSLPPRSYGIQMPSGRSTRRNRKDLLRTREDGIYREEDGRDFEWDVSVQQPARRPEPTMFRRQPPVTPVVQQEHDATPLITQSSPPKSPTSSQAGKTSRPPENRATSAQKEPEVTRSGRISNPPSRLRDFFT